MFFEQIIRVLIPGLILGVILGRLLAERPEYLLLLNPKLWIRKGKKASKNRWIRFITLSIIFAGIIFLGNLVSGKIAVTLWGSLVAEENIFTEISSISPWILIFLVTLLPILEEWMFRGIILEEVAQVTQSKWIGLLVSATVFSIFHLSNPGTHLPAVIPYLIGGLVIGGGYLAGGLAVAVGCHILYNLFLVI